MEYDIIIIGTTIDRITSAIYASKLGKKVLLIESNKLKEYVLSLENIKDYSLKKYIDLSKWRDQIVSYGGTIKNEEIIEIKNNQVITNKEIYNGKVILLATGARHELLGLENEKKFLGNGVHFCVNCDAPFYKNEIGCVVGGNDYALENALKLSSICKEVIIIEEHFRLSANELLIQEVLNTNNIKIYFNTKITRIIGDSKINKIVLNNIKEINVDCIFVSLGFIPNIEVINIKNMSNSIFITDDVKYKKTIEDGVSIAQKIINYLNDLK